MKEKNRFSSLLKHLMTVARIKNYTLAKELQYDESYISKWLTGTLLPTEKTSEKVFRDISRCIIASLDDESRAAFYMEYQLNQDRDLEEAIYDNLVAEFEYVTGLKETTGSEVAPKTAFYPELTLAQFLKKMRHPVLRQVKSLDVVLATDILSLDRHYQLSLAELDSNPNVNVAQYSFPGVRFSMLINLDVPENNTEYDVPFIQNLLTNLSNVDFQLYSCHQSQGKILFSVKDAYCISGMIMDENHCLAVTSSEEVKNCNAIYDRLQSLCNQDTLAVRRTNIVQMLRTNEYMQYTFARNQYWVLNHVTEHFLPEELFDQLADIACRRRRDLNHAALTQMRKLSSSVLENMKIKLFLSENGLNQFAVTGMVDFFGIKMYLTPQQRLQCLEYASMLPDKNPNLEYRVLHMEAASHLQHVPDPTVFLSDGLCYMRLASTGPENNLSVITHSLLCNMFRSYYKNLWSNESFVDSGYNATVEVIRYAMQMVQVQISAE